MPSPSLSSLALYRQAAARGGILSLKNMSVGNKRQMFRACSFVTGHFHVQSLSADGMIHPQHRFYHHLANVSSKGSLSKSCAPLTMTTPRHQVLRSRSALPEMDHEVETPPTSSIKPTPFLLADIGEGIAEVELMQWFVQEGDHVQQFDRVCEVQSDKATVEITSRYDGTVTSLEHSVGDMVKVGEPLLYIVAEHHEDDHHHQHRQEVAASAMDEQLNIPTIASKFHFDSDDDDDGQAPSSSVTRELDAKVLTSPAIRKLAKEHNLDLSTIAGTGPRNRVTKGDVLTVLKERGLVSPEPTMSSPILQAEISSQVPKARAIPAASASSSTQSPHELELPLQQDTVVPLRGYNRLMVSTMTASLQIPHMVYSDEINLNKFLQYKAEQQSENIEVNERLSFLPLTIKAASKALERFPLLNASYHGGKNEITLWKNHNIGVAMDTPRGLIVPVLKHCQDKSIPQLTQELKRLKEAAANGTVDADDLKGATFTISNIGAIGAGGKFMSPVVTPPQVAIGAIGKIERLPRFVRNTMEVEEAHICAISWGGDHRVVDGATMARFHTQWKAYVEDPVRLLMEMK